MAIFQIQVNVLFFLLSYISLHEVTICYSVANLKQAILPCMRNMHFSWNFHMSNEQLSVFAWKWHICRVLWNMKNKNIFWMFSTYLSCIKNMFIHNNYIWVNMTHSSKTHEKHVYGNICLIHEQHIIDMYFTCLYVYAFICSLIVQRWKVSANIASIWQCWTLSTLQYWPVLYFLVIQIFTDIKWSSILVIRKFLPLIYSITLLLTYNNILLLFC